MRKVYNNIKLFRDIRERYYFKTRVLTCVSGVKVLGIERLVDIQKFWEVLVDPGTQPKWFFLEAGDGNFPITVTE